MDPWTSCPLRGWDRMELVYMVFAGRAQSSMYILLAISETIQSTPSTSPCPLTAEHATMFQCRFTIESSLRICEKTGNQYAIGRKFPADTDTTHFFDFFQRQRPSEVLLVRKDKMGSACTHTPSTMSPDRTGHRHMVRCAKVSVSHRRVSPEQEGFEAPQHSRQAVVCLRCLSPTPSRLWPRSSCANSCAR